MQKDWGKRERMCVLYFLFLLPLRVFTLAKCLAGWFFCAFYLLFHFVFRKLRWYSFAMVWSTLLFKTCSQCSGNFLSLLNTLLHWKNLLLCVPHFCIQVTIFPPCPDFTLSRRVSFTVCCIIITFFLFLHKTSSLLPKSLFFLWIINLAHLTLIIFSKLSSEYKQYKYYSIKYPYKNFPCFLHFPIFYHPFIIATLW